ncbi:MAG: hypothetical protein KTR21_12195 [Rhodobacteraceae bacterium]|nr:hypothetical protein [Paracoccaceae bacterium]
MMEDIDLFENFDEFRDCYKEHVRPEGTLDRLRRAFEIDVEFQESFQLLRPYIRQFEEQWSQLIIEHVSRSRSASEAFDQKHAAAFEYIYKRHVLNLYSGNFDDDYLESVEEVALFMIYRDIKSVWLAGAYQLILSEMIGFVFENTEKHRLVKLERVVRLLARAIAIEMNQIQRVFTVLESYRLNVFITDLQSGGFLRSRAARRKSPMTEVTPRQVAIVQETFRSIAPVADLVAKKFYNRLFELDESLRPMFPEDLTPQRAKLVKTLSVAIERLDEIELIVPEIEALGRRHIEYEVMQPHYDTVGQALLWTLERGLGKSWDDDVAEAWTAVYTALSKTMIQAAEQSGQPAAS